jgi:predicted HicB family RNase H-like nuclease
MSKPISLNVRLPDDLHKRAVKEAAQDRRSLNSLILLAVEQYLADNRARKVRR